MVVENLSNDIKKFDRQKGARRIGLIIQCAQAYNLRMKKKIHCLRIIGQSTYWVFIKYCVFFEDFKIYSGLWPLSVSVSVHNGRSNTSAAAELAEFRKITTF